MDSFETSVAHKVAEKLGYKVTRFIGEGCHAKVFKLTDSLVLKITFDSSDAYMSMLLKKYKSHYLPEIYNVFRVKNLSKSQRNCYAILIEKLKTPSDIEFLFDETIDYIEENTIGAAINSVNIEKQIRKFHSESASGIAHYRQQPWSRKQQKFLFDIIEASKMFQQVGVKITDYKSQNIGINKYGNYTFLDLGYNKCKEQSLKNISVTVNEDS